MPYKKILWPTDTREPALIALKEAIALAETFQADLHVLHVVAPVPMLSQRGFTPPAPMSFNVPGYEKELVENMGKYLEKTIHENIPKGKAVESVVELGDPAEMIIDYVRRNKIELVVMATHGRKGLSHMFLGSVAEKVVRHSPVPVLTVPVLRREEE